MHTERPKLDRVLAILSAIQSAKGFLKKQTKTIVAVFPIPFSVDECLYIHCISGSRNTIDKHGSKIARNSVFDCHLSPVGRQMSIVKIFDLHSSTILMFSMPPIRSDKSKTTCIEHAPVFSILSHGKNISQYDISHQS